MQCAESYDVSRDEGSSPQALINSDMNRALAILLVYSALGSIAFGQDDGPSLGDVARQIRQHRAAAAAKAEDPPPPKIYTNQDIPEWSDEVTWKSSPTAETTIPAVRDAASEHPIKVKRQDVECSFFFRPQDLLPSPKLDDSGLKTLPAGDVAKLAGRSNRAPVYQHRPRRWDRQQPPL